MIHNRKSPRKKGYDYTSPWGYFVTICTKDRNHYFGDIGRGDSINHPNYFGDIGRDDSINHPNYFGDIGRDDSKNHPIMKLSQIGKICDQEIQKLSQRKSVDVHERIVMPNHIHILLIVDKYTIVGADHQSAINCQWSGDLSNRPYDEPINRPYDDPINRPYDGPSLSSIIKLLKWNISKMALQNNIPFWWQRSFHDHIIRNEHEYDRIKYYIQTNPANREKDSLQ